MRNTVFKVVVFSCAFITLSSASAQALTLNDLSLTEDPFHNKTRIAALQQTEKKAESKEQETTKTAEQTEPKAPVTHVVASGETLTVIAQSKGLNWKRLYDKNTQVANPDVLTVGEVLTIPEPDEQLAERPLPTTAQTSTPAPSMTSGAVSYMRGSSADNTYAPGYCTWYAKNRRPDLPNRMGNASSWVASAAAQGFATGSSPRAGAIGQQGNHVVYVESVNGDGTVTVSEMNYSGLFVVSSRTVAANSFHYIY